MTHDVEAGPGNTIEVDARGLRCPLPVIRLGEAARGAPVGTLIVVLASDPAARHDIPAWCRMRAHELREVTEVTVTEATEATEVTEVTEVTEDAPQPAHLRFLILIRSPASQPSKAAGAGSGSERRSRAR